jgi:phenylacetic acid degradation operon negative regulatory protein
MQVIYHELIARHQLSVELQDPAVLAPTLGARRDRSATIDTGRGLLMTVLGELVLPNGGAVWTQTLIETMELLDVRPKAARQSIARMHDRGWLDRTKMGRRTRWQLTVDAEGLLASGARRIYDFGRQPKTWDGRWLVLLARVPERNRNLRYRMSVGLSWAGFGSLGQGTWLSPWTCREERAVQLLDDLGVNATSFVAELGQLGSGTDLATQAWDLPVLQARYEGFLSDTTGLVGGVPDGASAVADLVALVHRWRHFPFLDPDLPAELLPADWPAPDAVRRFADLRAALLGPAIAWWMASEESLAIPSALAESGGRRTTTEEG